MKPKWIYVAFILAVTLNFGDADNSEKSSSVKDEKVSEIL